MFSTQILDQTDDDWLAVRRNFKCERRILGGLGMMQSMEGADPNVEAMFYRAVTQAVLLF